MRKFVYATLATLACIIGLLVPVSTTFASGVSDPLVAVAEDATASTHCSGSTILNVGTPRQTTVHYSCPAGSVIKTQVMNLSEAKAQHKSYVVLPSSNTSQQESQKVALQIEQLRATVSKQAASGAKKASASSQAVAPLIGCGTTATPYRWWTANGDSVYTSVTYTKSVNCSAVFIQQSVVQGNNSINPLYWVRDAYASYVYNTSCTFIGTRAWYISPNTSQPQGYGYEHILQNNCNWAGYTSYNDYIVLN